MAEKKNSKERRAEKRALRERILRTAGMQDSVIARIEIWQDRPWTAVQVTFRDGTPSLPASVYGFTKVCHPDEWDAEFGIDLAATKALANALKGMPDEAVTALSSYLTR